MSYFVHKWLVGFLLVLLLYAANARLSEPDWSNLDKEIDDGRWCEEGDHCRPRLTNSSAEEDDGSWKEMNFAKPSEMDDEELVLYSTIFILIINYCGLNCISIKESVTFL